MRLHEAPSPNARRVHIFMAEKGIDCPRVTVDIRAGENIQAEYLGKNPAGRVPVLELDDGSFLAESVAICRYLDWMQPEPRLFGAPGIEAATIEMWNRRAELNFMANVAAAFRNITGFFQDRETCVKEWGEVAANAASRFVGMFDAQLAKTEYLAGDHFSIADITFVVAWDFARRVKVVPLPDAPNVARWHSLIASRPSYKAE
ncbi:MAG: glutathione S-transferase family protein [Gammaproteobacteria bacterium]|jgi:glutathione S-transferase|nr:glutathione S-transferase family protein [Gammaproteobacteria bacterium]